MTTESPETFRVHLEWHDSRVFFKMKVTWGNKICSYFIFYSLYNVWKGQLHRVSGPEFYEWLYGTKKFSGLSRNGLQRLWYNANNELFSTFCSEDPWVLLPLNNKDFFCSLLACSATMSSKGSSPLVYSHNKSVHIEGYNYERDHEKNNTNVLFKFIINTSQQERVSPRLRNKIDVRTEMVQYLLKTWVIQN